MGINLINLTESAIYQDRTITVVIEKKKVVHDVDETSRIIAIDNKEAKEQIKKLEYERKSQSNIQDVLTPEKSKLRDVYLKYGNNPLSTSVLSYAIHMEDIEAVKTILNSIERENGVFKRDQIESILDKRTSHTALHFAIQGKNMPIIKQLMTKENIRYFMYENFVVDCLSNEFFEPMILGIETYKKICMPKLDSSTIKHLVFNSQKDLGGKELTFKGIVTRPGITYNSVKFLIDFLKNNECGDFLTEEIKRPGLLVEVARALPNSNSKNLIIELLIQHGATT